MSALSTPSGDYVKHASFRIFLLYLMIYSIPFSGMRDIMPLGELSGEGFFYTSLLFMIVSIFHLLVFGVKNIQEFVRPFKFHSAYILIILLSFFLNFSSIFENYYGSRSGFSKFATSLLVLSYYMALSGFFVLLAKRIGYERFVSCVSTAFTHLSWAILLVSVLEVVGWYVLEVKSILTYFRSSYSLVASTTPFRISGFSMEPSFYAMSILTCIPWVFRSYVLQRRWYQGALLFMLFALCILSGSRTAYVSIAFLVSIFISFWFRPLRSISTYTFPLLVMSLFVFGLIIPYYFGNNVSPHDSVSNITRSIIGAKSIDLGIENFLGVGFGQVPFHLPDMQEHSFSYSWELLNFFTGDRYGEAVPLYSWYARTFGEFGPIGYLIIMCYWVFITIKFSPVSTGKLSEMDLNRMMGLSLLILFLSFGWSSDSLRSPSLWIGTIILCASSSYGMKVYRSLI